MSSNKIHPIFLRKKNSFPSKHSFVYKRNQPTQIIHPLIVFTTSCHPSHQNTKNNPPQSYRENLSAPTPFFSLTFTYTTKKNRKNLKQKRDIIL